MGLQQLAVAAAEYLAARVEHAPVQSRSCHFFSVRSFLRSSFLVTQKSKKDRVVGVGRSLRDIAV